MAPTVNLFCDGRGRRKDGPKRGLGDPVRRSDITAHIRPIGACGSDAQTSAHVVASAQARGAGARTALGPARAREARAHFKDCRSAELRSLKIYSGGTHGKVAHGTPRGPAPNPQ